MANIFSNDVLHIVSIPQKFYLANELYVSAVMLLDTETKELILAQNSQNPDVYAELFRIGGVCNLPESWRVDPFSIIEGDYTEDSFIITKTDLLPVLGGYLCNSQTNTYRIDVQTAIPVISDIQLSAGLNNITAVFEDVGNNLQFLDISGTVANEWRLKFTVSGTYVFVLGQINWIKFKIDGVDAICRVNITPNIP